MAVITRAQKAKAAAAAAAAKSPAPPRSSPPAKPASKPGKTQARATKVKRIRKAQKEKSGVKERMVSKKKTPKKAKGKAPDIETFFKRQKVPYHTPGDVEYERAVLSSNLLYRFSRPHWVVLPSLPVHVQKVVQQAKFRNVSITIKNGGHSFSGSSSTGAGILLDLSKMNKVELDIKSKTITIEAGALWGHAYKAFINGRHDGYMVNGGRCPNVGVGGYILGGGLGPFGRSFGMGCDDLIEATIVTVNGRLITVKDSDDPQSAKGMLFWALQGAGGGNFGVVLELKLRVHKMRTDDGIVVAGRYTWYPTDDEKDSGAVISTMNAFYTTLWPDHITIDSSWFCDLQQKGGGLGIRFRTYCNGDQRDFEEYIKKLIKHGDLAHQIVRRSLPENSTRFLHESLVSLWNEETQTSLPLNPSYRVFSSFVFARDADIIDKVTMIVKEELAHFKQKFRGEEGVCQVSHPFWRRCKQERTFSALGISATAFRWREGIFHTYIMVSWDDKWLERDMRGFFKIFKAKLRPFSLTGQAAFINFSDVTLKPGTHEKAYFGNNRQRLQEVKRIWDEENFFSWSQGVSLPKEDGESPLMSPIQIVDEARRASMAAEVREDQASDGEFSVDEEALTDVVAGRQWNTQDSILANDFDWLGIHGIPYKWWRESDEDHDH